MSILSDALGAISSLFSSGANMENETKLRLRVICLLNHLGKDHVPGDIIFESEDVARALVDAGIAELAPL